MLFNPVASSSSISNDFELTEFETVGLNFIQINAHLRNQLQSWVVSQHILYTLWLSKQE